MTSYYTIQEFQQRAFDHSYVLEPSISDIFKHILDNIIIPNDSEIASTPTVSRPFYPSSSSRNNDGSDWNDHQGGNSNSTRGKSFKGRRNGVRPRHTTPPINDTVDAEPFKATKLETKEGLEKEVTVLRGILNKISSKNYLAQKSLFIEQVKKMMVEFTSSSEDTNEDVVLKKVSDVIFQIATTNYTQSALYSSLYKEVVDLFPQFSSMITSYLDEYSNSIHETAGSSVY
jgi:hypothetical protein